jgi:hypothetical protein
MDRRMLTSLAAYVVQARDIPLAGQTREAALRCLFDLIVAAAAGHADRGPQAVRRVADLMGQGTVPVWFSGRTASALGAAWANSAAASAQDLDDGHRLARGHPGAVVIPAALAVGQARQASWERILSAIAIGYEVGITIAAARRSYGNTGTWGAYAGSDSISVTPSCRMLETCKKEVDTSCTIHLPFQHLQPVDLAFSLAVGPRLAKRRRNGVEIGREPARKGRQSRRLRLIQPVSQPVLLAVADH